MKFTLSSTIITQVLSKLGKTLNNKGSVPILSGLFIEATNDDIRFIAADDSSSVAIPVPLDESTITVELPGKTVIPKEAFNTIHKLKGTIEFELSKDLNTIHVVQKEDNFKLSFQTFLAIEFPDVTDMDSNSTPFQMSFNRFKSLVNETVHAVATSDSRPVLKSVNFVVKKDSISAVATDAHRMAYAIDNTFTSQLNDDEEISLPVPGEMLKNMVKAFEQDSDVYLLFSPNSFAAMSNSIVFKTRIIEGNFPDTSKLVPESFDTFVTLDRGELLQTLNILSDMTDKSSVEMSFSDMFTSIKSQGSVSHGLRELAHAELNGDSSLKIAFNATYLKESLLVLENEKVTIEFGKSLTPFVLRESRTSLTALHLLLPVRAY